MTWPLKAFMSRVSKVFALLYLPDEEGKVSLGHAWYNVRRVGLVFVQKHAAHTGVYGMS